MDELIGEAAETLLPLLTAGAGAAATAMAEQGGTRMADGATHLLARLRSRISGTPSEPEVRDALVAALDEDGVTREDLVRLLDAVRPAPGPKNVAGGNIYDGANITVHHGGFHGGNVGS